MGTPTNGPESTDEFPPEKQFEAPNTSLINAGIATIPDMETLRECVLVGDMNHRKNDFNYFQAPSLNLGYADTEVEYIEQRKAKQYDGYAKVSLFRAIWTDIFEQFGERKPTTRIFHS